MREPLIAGNWKMHTGVGEAVALVQEMKERLHSTEGVEKLLCPPFVSLYPVANLLKGTTIKLGAQNCYFLEQGAYTGEVSASMLVGLCQYVILGHSERRQLFGEDNATINKKVRAALKVGLWPILCVGERLKEREEGRTEEVIGEQIRAGLKEVDSLNGLVVAYEPIWAIGTGKAAKGEDANTTTGFIRRTVAGLLGEKAAASMRILYGGSVTSANIAEFAAAPEVDGALVGGASLKPAEFLGIVEQTARLGAGKGQA